MQKNKKLLILIAVPVIAGIIFWNWLQDKYVVPVLMYHNVDYVDPEAPKFVNPERFAWHMEFLKKNGYDVISLDEFVTAVKNNKPLSRKSVVITFDDGYRDNYTEAFPVLKKYGFPATIFVSVEDTGKEEYLTWSQIREMDQAAINIGSHTLNQTYLPDAEPKEQWRQIKESKEILENRLGHPVYYFAYPSGGFDKTIKEYVKKSGYKGACTTNRGYDPRNKDVYEINRIRLSDKDNSAVILFVKLSGFYNLFRKPKDPY